MIMLDFISSNDQNAVDTTLVSMCREATFNFDLSSMHMKLAGSTDLWDGLASKPFQKMTKLQISRNLGIGYSVLGLMSIVCIIVVVFDGILCLWLTNRESKKYLSME
jgi:hypothetical protein